MDKPALALFTIIGAISVVGIASIFYPPLQYSWIGFIGLGVLIPIVWWLKQVYMDYRAMHDPVSRTHTHTHTHTHNSERDEDA